VGGEPRGPAMLGAPPASLRPRAEALCAAILLRAPAGLHAEVVRCASEAGSGALPALAIPSMAVALRRERASADVLVRALRLEPTPLFAVVREGRGLLDVRTLADSEVPEAAEVVPSAAAGLG